MNHRHADFQSAALPTELSGHFRSLKNLRFWRAGLFGAPKVSGVITSCSDMASAIAKFFDSFFTAPVDGWNPCPVKAGLWLESAIHHSPALIDIQQAAGSRRANVDDGGGAAGGHLCLFAAPCRKAKRKRRHGHQRRHDGRRGEDAAGERGDGDRAHHRHQA